jgi:hypothetical protein
MAATEVILFHFYTQAVHGVNSLIILKPSFLFEHSPPVA